MSPCVVTAAVVRTQRLTDWVWMCAADASRPISIACAGHVRRITYVLFVCQLRLHARHVLYLSCATDRASCVSQNVHLHASHCLAHVESRLAQPRTCSFQEYMFGCIPYNDAVAVVLSDYVRQTEPPHRAYFSAVFHFTDLCMPGPRAPDRQALIHG